MNLTDAKRSGRTPPSNDAAWRPVPGSGFRETGRSLLWGLLLAAPFLLLSGWKTYSTLNAREEARLAAIAAAQAHERLVAAPAAPTVPLEDAVRGRDLFLSTCVACHGADGRGVAGLGKDLTVSDFVAMQTDESFRQFLVEGRPTARPVPMPPKAGRTDLTDDDFDTIVAYVRGLQDPRRMPELPPVVAAAGPSEEQKSAALAAAGGDEELAAWIASGDRIFHSACVACHGQGGVGIAGNGKPLVKNAFIASLDDDGLLEFIKQGRGPTDPKNTTGIQMPPKGGNPALSDDDILDVISYLRTLQPSAVRSAAAD